MEFTSRYEALGIPYPDPATMCVGQCEGTGMYPQSLHDPSMTAREIAAWAEAHRKGCGLRGRLRSLWRGATRRDRVYLSMAWERCDGWHFIACPDCGGTGKRALL